MKVLVTGSAGFIGSALSLRLLERGDEVIGIDNLSPYYDVELKRARLARTLAYPGYTEVRIDLEDRAAVTETFARHSPQRVVNLAAQAGVRYSLENPFAYVDTNLVGFLNILEGCRHHGVEHLVYASSSSVYGANTRMPFSVHDNQARRGARDAQRDIQVPIAPSPSRRGAKGPRHVLRPPRCGTARRAMAPTMT